MGPLRTILCLAALAPWARAIPLSTSTEPSPARPRIETHVTVSGVGTFEVHPLDHLDSLTAGGRNAVIIRGGRVDALTLNDDCAGEIAHPNAEAATRPVRGPWNADREPLVGNGVTPVKLTGRARLKITGGAFASDVDASGDSTLVMGGGRFSPGGRPWAISASQNAAVHVHGTGLRLDPPKPTANPRFYLTGRRGDDLFGFEIILKDAASLHLHDGSSPEKVIPAWWLGAEARRAMADAAMVVPAPAAGAAPVVPPSASPAFLLLMPAVIGAGGLLALALGAGRRERIVLSAARAIAVTILVGLCSAVVWRWIARPMPESVHTSAITFAPPRWLVYGLPAAAIVLGLLAVAIGRLRAIATALSLLILVAVVAQWVRSYRHHDQVTRESATRLDGELRGNVLRRQVVVRSSGGGVGVFASTRLSTDDRIPQSFHLSWRWEGNRVRPDRPWAADEFWGPGGFARRWGMGVHHRTYKALTSPPLATFRAAVVLPYWVICLPLAILPGTAIGRLARRRRRRAKGLCPACGYDLRASTQRCPECGTASVGMPSGSSLSAPSPA